MSLSKHRRSTAPAGAVALAAAVVVGAPAQAQTVTHLRFSFPDEGVITDLCPFPIAISGTIAGNLQDVRDNDGNLVRVDLHFANDYTLQANGVTLVERDRYNEFDLDFEATGGGAPSRIVVTGLWTHIKLPGGRNVTVEAGRITENLVTGEVTRTGRFSISEGDTAAFCAAFS